MTFQGQNSGNLPQTGPALALKVHSAIISTGSRNEYFGKRRYTLLTNYTGSTLAPWLLGGLLLLVLLTVTITIRAWRDAKRSPYFFMRRQAQQRMQNYSLASLALIAATLFTAAYAQKPPQDTTPRVALIAKAKPISVTAAEETGVAVDEAPRKVVINSRSPVSTTDSLITVDSDTSDDDAERNPAFAPAERLLPDQYNQEKAQVELSSSTKLTNLVFSQEVNGYTPANPRTIFTKGFFTIYATFDYEGMANGMAWSWVWRYNGEVIDGGNKLWEYGDSGPGYVFLNPEEGFQPGRYSVGVWVNGELLSEGTLTVTGSAVNNQ